MLALFHIIQFGLGLQMLLRLTGLHFFFFFGNKLGTCSVQNVHLLACIYLRLEGVAS